MANIEFKTDLGLSAEQHEILAKYFNVISNDREEQKEKFKRVKDCYYGRYSAWYETFFESVVSDFSDQNNLIFDDALFTRDVVQNLALMYREVPERKFHRNGVEVSEKEDEYLKSIYKGFGNLSDQTLNEMVKALSTAEQEVYYDEQDDCLKVRNITPELYDIIQDVVDPTKKLALIYEVYSEDSANRKQQITTRFIYWDNEHHGQFEITYQIRNKTRVTTYYPIEFNEINYVENPFKMIPFIKVVDSQTFNDYYQDDNANIFDNAEQILTIKASAKAQSYVYQGFNIPVLTTGTPKKFTNIKLSPAHMLVMQKGSQGESDDRVEFVTNSDLLTSVENAYANAYLSKLKPFGISEGEGNATSNMSGISIALSNDQKNKVINADREKYVKFEQERFELIKKVNNHYAGGNLKAIPEDIGLMVDFKEIRTEIGVDEQIKLDTFYRDYGMKSRFRMMQDENPDWSEDEIRKEMAEIDKERAISLTSDVEPIDDGLE